MTIGLILSVLTDTHLGNQVSGQRIVSFGFVRMDLSNHEFSYELFFEYAENVSGTITLVDITNIDCLSAYSLLFNITTFMMLLFFCLTHAALDLIRPLSAHS